MVTVTVAGHPITQGSKQAIRRRDGGISMIESGGDRLTQWRHAINDEARHATNGTSPATGPVTIEAHFTIPKPASTPKRRRTWPIKTRSGDLDKLARAALDAMTGVVYTDDAQVIDLHVTKDLADHDRPPGVAIIVIFGDQA